MRSATVTVCVCRSGCGSAMLLSSGPGRVWSDVRCWLTPLPTSGDLCVPGDPSAGRGHPGSTSGRLIGHHWRSRRRAGLDCRPDRAARHGKEESLADGVVAPGCCGPTSTDLSTSGGSGYRIHAASSGTAHANSLRSHSSEIWCPEQPESRFW